MSKPVRFLGIAGSLRRESYNRAALREATKLPPEDATLDIFELDGIPGPQGEKYCSKYCHDMHQLTELSCKCGHPGCAEEMAYEGWRDAIGCGASGELIPELLRTHCWLGICAPPFGPGHTPLILAIRRPLTMLRFSVS